MNTGMRLVRALTAGLLLLGAPACARTDWIEGTLVTVDVSGVWKGRTQASIQGDIEMSLTQRGSRVTGDARVGASNIRIEGTVRGDVFAYQPLSTDASYWAAGWSEI